MKKAAFISFLNELTSHCDTTSQWPMQFNLHVIVTANSLMIKSGHVMVNDFTIVTAPDKISFAKSWLIKTTSDWARLTPGVESTYFYFEDRRPRAPKVKKIFIKKVEKRINPIVRAAMVADE